MTPGTNPASRSRLVRREPSSLRSCAFNCAVCAMNTSPQSSDFEFPIGLLVVAAAVTPVEQGADGLVVVDAVNRLADEVGDAQHLHAVLDRVEAAADRDG